MSILNRLVRFTAAFVHGQTFLGSWPNVTSHARIEPVLIKDGHVDYVLMEAGEFRRQHEASALLEGLTQAELGAVAGFRRRLLNERREAQIGSQSNLKDILPVLAKMVRPE